MKFLPTEESNRKAGNQIIVPVSLRSLYCCGYSTITNDRRRNRSPESDDGNIASDNFDGQNHGITRHDSS